MRAVVLASMLVAACKSDPKPEVAKPPPFGTSVHMIGALEGVTIGMKIADVVARVPGLQRIDNLPPEKNPELGLPPPSDDGDLKLKPSDMPFDPPPPPPGVEVSKPREYMVYWLQRDKVRYKVTSYDGVIELVEITVPERAIADVENAWGPAIKGEHDFVFLDRANQWRARVEGYASQYPITLAFERYLPLASIVDADPSKLFGTPVIGQPAVAAMKPLLAHSTSREGWFVTLPPAEYSSHELLLKLFLDEAQIVTGYQLSAVLSDPSDAMFDEVVALYTKLWGNPQTVGDFKASFGSGTPKIEMDRRYGSVHVSANQGAGK